MEKKNGTKNQINKQINKYKQKVKKKKKKKTNKIWDLWTTVKDKSETEILSNHRCS